LSDENNILMNVTLVLEMAASAAAHRPVVSAGDRSLTAPELAGLARSAAVRFGRHRAVLYLAPSHLGYPVALFGAALAGVPFVPLNYRLGRHQLAAVLDRHPGGLLLRPADLDGLLDPGESFVDISVGTPDGDRIAAVIYTSGTTAEPKPAVLRHRHLLAYLLNTVEFGSADPGDAALVAVPPYHVAGLANLLSNLYAGRRVVYLPAFDPGDWLATVRRERVTHAMLVPTMLARIVALVHGDDAGTPTLRSIAYGGAPTPRPVLERALRVFGTTGFVNAYGLTETASSVAVLGPAEHRAAAAATDPAVRARLGSVGRALPGIEIQVRSAAGTPLPAGETGLVHVRGEQVAGEYGAASTLDADGWFATRDRGRLDADGYLFLAGRADDTIIRGGENIAPAEVEDVLLAHPGVAEAAVVGVPDAEWGQRLVAVVVGSVAGPAADAEEIRDWVRQRLRSARTPDTVLFRTELPRTETGKLLRRALLAELEADHA
jgi:acyl-CoA synthetase (AMP-forming)/AMP-acid ligase II